MTEHTENTHVVAETNGTAPPVGEEIHFGVAFLATTIRWVADVRRDIAELPLDHSHH
jgi:hypothetical protein